jgi:hypothetical protein
MSTGIFIPVMVRETSEGEGDSFISYLLGSTIGIHLSRRYGYGYLIKVDTVPTGISGRVKTPGYGSNRYIR